MDVALASKKFLPASLKHINYCRLYLNVTLLSDITLPDGEHLDQAAYIGDRSQMLSMPRGHTVNQAKPNIKAWQDWRKLLHLLVHRDSKYTLKTPLTTWVVASSAYTRRWKYLYSPTQDLLFTHTAVGFLAHKRLHYDFDKDPIEFTETLPQDAVPVKARSAPHTWIIPRRIAGQTLPPSNDTACTTIKDCVGGLQDWEVDLLQEAQFIRPEEIVWEILQNTHCHAASDGLAPKDQGSFGWIISDRKGERLVQCRGPAFGHAISLYRAEAYGMLSIL